MQFYFINENKISKKQQVHHTPPPLFLETEIDASLYYKVI